uniref:Ribonuclease H-like domain-containing protein n=1 Tax=Tanacetum cinerariifolium TaxID=118510 RepID=A0A6L2NIU2_TANCI|nr:ribonuclease H-like domain-containing protein [Tanacetum cinerariifolium]
MALDTNCRITYNIHMRGKKRTPWTIKGVLSLDLSKVTTTLQAKAVDPSFRIQQVVLNLVEELRSSALWEVIEFGDSYKAPPKETAKGKGLAGEVSASTKKKGRTVAITVEDMQKRKNDVKARTTLLLALPDEHQLRFKKYDSVKEVWEAILKTFGRNKATKKTKKNQLKQQYGNFKAEGSETLKQTFNRLQAIIDDDDTEEMDIKWNLALLSMRADRFWKKTGKKITIQGSAVVGFDKSKVECFNCHKMGYFTRECRSPKSQDKGKRGIYKKDPKVEEPAPKAMIAIDGIGWDRSYMVEEDEASKNHVLVADEEKVQTEYALMAKSSSSSDNEMCLPKFVDDTVTDYTRPTPSIDVSKSVSKELEERWKSDNPSFFEQGGSSGIAVSKPMIKFVKESGCPNVTKVNNTKNARKPIVKYAKMYINTSQSPRVRGNQRNWNNKKSNS